MRLLFDRAAGPWPNPNPTTLTTAQLQHTIVAAIVAAIVSIRH